ncbi:MAG: GGDEF domain-containing protein [Polyangiales bacterium]
MGTAAAPSSPPIRSELADVRALRDVTQPEVWRLLARCPVRALEAGEVLLHAGQANDRMYVVLEGRLSVRLQSASSEPVATIDRGSTVGELSVIDRQPATAWVVAEAPSRLLTIAAEDFWRIVEGSPAFTRQLIVDLTARVRRSTATLVTTLDANVELEERATVDPLTGVLNRRGLAQRGARLVQRASTGDEPLSLALVDVDHFKRFNDAHGHPAGDAALVCVARALVEGVRPTDVVARYGGEEFVVLLPRTTREEAVAVAERLRLAVRAAVVRGTDGAPLPGVTLSAGVAQLKPGETLEESVSRADGRLYEAKAAGRDRVV